MYISVHKVMLYTKEELNMEQYFTKFTATTTQTIFNYL